MRIALTLLGLDVFALEVSTDADPTSTEPDLSDLSGGTTCSTPIGFTPSPGDQRWESGVDYH